jgi:hypothetical protein
MEMLVQITVPFLIRGGDLHRDSIGKIAPFGMGGGCSRGVVRLGLITSHHWSWGLQGGKEGGSLNWSYGGGGGSRSTQRSAGVVGAQG